MSAPTVEVYDQEGNFILVAQVETKLGGGLIVTVDTEEGE